MKKFLVLVMTCLLCACLALFGACGCDSEDEEKITTETINNVEYYVYQGHYYLMVEESLTWHEAELACEEQGGYLATVNNYKEWDTATRMSGQKNVWLGATDGQQEGVWQWVTGEEFKFNYWHKDEPSKLTTENFLGVHLHSNEGRLGCAMGYGTVDGYICEWDSKEDIGVSKYRYVKQISTLEELKSLSNNSGIYLLTADIDLASESEWKPIENFNGLFIGNGHTIKNLKMSPTNVKNLGLFATIRGGVYNLNLENVQMTAVGDTGYAGALVGSNYGKIENITVTGSINIPYYSYVGGVAGLNDSGTITNCVNKAVITGKDCVGGIAGKSVIKASGAFNGNSNEGEINGKKWVGGLAGYVSSSSDADYREVLGLKNVSKITGENQTGGIFGEACVVSLKNLENTGEIIGSARGQYFGGIAGMVSNAAVIYGNKNTANITAENSSFVGGIVGHATFGGEANAAKDNTNSGNIIGTQDLGGIFGAITCTSKKGTNTYDINNCSNSGKIVGTQGRIGGIIGYALATTSSWTEKEWNDKKWVLWGGYQKVEYTSDNYFTLTTLTNTGEVIGGNDYNDMGGIVGLCTRVSTISVCKNTADVTGGINVGGIAGYCPDTTIKSAGIPHDAKVSGVAFVGGFAGTAKQVEDSINNGVITASGKDRDGWACLGGVVGRAEVVLRCVNNADINYTGGGRMVGGIVGYLDDTATTDICIENENNGNITGRMNVGGIAGYIDSNGNHTIDNNQNSGKISGTERVGGIAGELWKADLWEEKKYTLTNCTNTGVIEGTSHFGGIIGILGNACLATSMDTNTTTYGDKIGS